MLRLTQPRRVRVALAATALAILAISAASLFFSVSYHSAGPSFYVRRGCLSAMWMTDGSSNIIPSVSRGWRAGRIRTRPLLPGAKPERLIYLRPSFHESSPIDMGAVKVIHGSSLPLWIPLVVTALPAAALWRRTRRPTPGICRHCGYDLSGNATGKCPECGREQAR